LFFNATDLGADFVFCVDVDCKNLARARRHRSIWMDVHRRLLARIQRE